ncbi:MAG: multi-sensor signal transduction histidine kinase [Ramlibacter sp.]|uniref:PAS domain S-box protein n=1 Tax=Ramlibacter sp. TaxID=1917967 RepID=UPI00260AF18C|nr:PAS domain S-box protein [Ramlibacter sp.]MDB5751481.1 multi-sensor signal transduction histidine kinase [Ramlibacter sp.]
MPKAGGLKRAAFSGNELLAGEGRLPWLVVSFAVLTGALLVIALWVLRTEALRAGETRAVALSQVIAEQTSRTLQSVDTRLQLAEARLDALAITGGLDEPAGSRLLQAQLVELPFMGAIWVLDPQGRVVFDSASASVGLELAHRAYFRHHRDAPDVDFHVGPPIRSRITGRWQLTASRPLRTGPAGPKGIIVAAIEPPYFEQLWGRVDAGGTGSVALYNRHGVLLLRSPANPSLLGQDMSGLPLFTDHLPRAPEGRVLLKSVYDAVDRVGAYRVIPAHPQLVVVVGIGQVEMLAPWRRFALLSSVFWGGAMLIAIGLALQLQRQAGIRAASERRFRALAQAMPQIVFIANPRGLVQFVSQRWAEVTGVPVEQAIGTGWQERLHPEDRAGALEHIIRVLESGMELQLEMRLRHSDGSDRWQLLRAVPIRDEAGAITAWYGTATDIDALKQAQARLVSQAEFLRMAGRLARLGGWRLDLASQQITWSEEAAAIVELSPSDAPSMQQVLAMFTGDSLAIAQRALRESMETGVPFDIEVELVAASGRRLWIRSLGQPVRNAEGRIVAVQGAQQDITARLRMVEEIRQLNVNLEEKVARRTRQLAQQEALFRTLAEQAPLPFWTVDASGAATFFSRAWYQLVGGTPPRWQGFAWMELLHPDDVGEARANWGRARAGGTVYAGTRRLRARDGSYHSTVYRAEPIRDAQGEVAFWVGIDTDITDILQSKAELRLANEQLEAFAYSVSHDLQSPLQRVLSFGRLLQEELGVLPSGRAQHYLARIMGNAETMTHLMDGLLALAQVSEVDIIRGTVNLSDMGAEVLQRLQQDQPQRRVRWSVQPGLAVQGDVRLMRSVLENLLGNAWKFTGRVDQAQITLGSSAQAGEFFVRDNGAGFDMAYADRLFSTFQRLHDAEEFPGTGIGLATVARAISRQGGRVWAQAAPGEGATFYFTLPTA